MPWKRTSAAPTILQISHLCDAQLPFYIEVYRQSHSLHWDCSPHLKIRLARMLSWTEVWTNYATTTSQEYPNSSMSFLTGLHRIAARHPGTNQVVSLAKPGPATSRAAACTELAFLHGNGNHLVWWTAAPWTVSIAAQRSSHREVHYWDQVGWQLFFRAYPKRVYSQQTFSFLDLHFSMKKKVKSLRYHKNPTTQKNFFFFHRKAP